MFDNIRGLIDALEELAGEHGDGVVVEAGGELLGRVEFEDGSIVLS